MLRLGSHHLHMNPISPMGMMRGGGGGGGGREGTRADLLMDLTNSAAEGWRMRSRKSCQASGAVEDPKASPPPSIVAGSGVPGNRQLRSADCWVLWRVERGGGQGSPQMDRRRGDFLYCRSRKRQRCGGGASGRAEMGAMDA